MAELKSIPWQAQVGPQLDAIRKHWIPELFFGGAVGGGKSDFLLGDFGQDVPRYGPAWRGIVFRKSYPQLEELILRAQELFPPWFCLKWKEQWMVGDKTLRWPNGSSLKFRHLENDDAWTEYQGHQYCVAEGTPILRPDGTYTPIEQIKIGDLVQTLEGPKAVTATMPRRWSECVRAESTRGTQVHPTDHPVMLSLSEWGSYASLTGGRTCNAEFRGSRPEIPRPLSWSGRAVLYAPGLQSDGSCLATPTEHRASCKFEVPSSATLTDPQESSSNRAQPQAPGPQSQDCIASLSDAAAQMRACSDEQSETSTRDSLLDCRDDLHFCDAPVRYASVAGQVSAPSPNDAGRPGPSSSHSDDTGCTRDGTIPFSDTSLTYSHPYTKELRPLRARLESGLVSMASYGYAWVRDLSVADANHYITKAGFVNKNTWIGFDELPQWATPKAYMELKTRLRSAHAIPNKRIRSTGNPGGVGHGWIKKHFGIDRYPLGSKIIEPDTIGGTRRIFIRSRVQDNKILLANDPSYIARLQDLGSEVLVRQYLEGDWAVVAGAFFPEFNVNRHVVHPFAIPKDWTRFRSFDWGAASPFSVGWYAVSDGSLKGIPRGALVKYREWYGAKEVNKMMVGLKMPMEEIASGILEREDEDETMAMSVADPKIFAEEGGPSLGERSSKVFRERADGTKVFCTFQRADNERKNGADMVRMRFKGEVDEEEPMIFFFTTCTDTIRTIPGLQHDKNKPEDVDTKGEDHCFAAGTLVSTPGGDVPIEQMPPEGTVDTRHGVEHYRSARQTGFKETVLLTFSDGSTVRCTPDHRFVTEGGWTEAKDLKGCLLPQYRCRSTAKNSWECATTDVVPTFSAKEFDSTGKFGSTTLAPFLMDGTFITPTIGVTTIIQRICDWWRARSISRTMRSSTPTNTNASSRPLELLPRLLGTRALKGESGTSNIAALTTLEASASFSSVPSVKRSSKDGRSIDDPSSADRIASSVRCVGVEPMPSAPVYCITVPTTAEFLLSNGLAVSNCYDELRYACMARPWIRKAGTRSKPRFANEMKTEGPKVICTTTFNDLVKQSRARRKARE